MELKHRLSPRIAFAVITVGMLLTGCATTSTPDCALADTHDLDRAIDSARDRLQNGCVAHFDGYMDDLLVVAAGDPAPGNKEAFSDFLVWASDTGLLSRRQSQETWNRYFNVKFVSLRGDYNNCAQTCPTRARLMKDMEAELADKERGMLQAALDRDGYYRADRLFSETELVLEATCRACEAGGR